MIHNHHHDLVRGAVKHARLKSPPLPLNASDVDDARPEAMAHPTTGNGGTSGGLSYQQRLELGQASERNKHFVNTIQSVWPTPSA